MVVTMCYYLMACSLALFWGISKETKTVISLDSLTLSWVVENATLAIKVCRKKTSNSNSDKPIMRCGNSPPITNYNTLTCLLQETTTRKWKILTYFSDPWGSFFRESPNCIWNAEDVNNTVSGLIALRSDDNCVALYKKAEKTVSDYNLDAIGTKAIKTAATTRLHC